MDVEINEIVSTVHTVDSRALLSSTVLRRLLETITRALAEQAEHDKRAEGERRVTGGVSAERDQED